MLWGTDKVRHSGLRCDFPRDKRCSSVRRIRPPGVVLRTRFYSCPFIKLSYRYSCYKIVTDGRPAHTLRDDQTPGPDIRQGLYAPARAFGDRLAGPRDGIEPDRPADRGIVRPAHWRPAHWNVAPPAIALDGLNPCCSRNWLSPATRSCAALLVSAIRPTTTRSMPGGGYGRSARSPASARSRRSRHRHP